MSGQYKVAWLCEALLVSRSGYYDWKERRRSITPLLVQSHSPVLPRTSGEMLAHGCNETKLSHGSGRRKCSVLSVLLRYERRTQPTDFQ
jgi:hypothetical protein